MSSITTVSIGLEPDLATLLEQAATAAGLTREAVIIECLSQQLEVALRHRALLSRLEEMDRHVVALAEFIGEATAPADAAQIGSICRYRPGASDGA